ncbi:hypothetical protein MY11210_009298 [Beauveria gryllotalpidicola]
MADDSAKITVTLWVEIDGHFAFIQLSGRTVERVFKRFKASYALCHPELAPEPSVVRQIIAKSASETLGEYGMWMWDELPTRLELEVSGQSCEERRSAIVQQMNSKPSIPILRARLEASKAQKSVNGRKLELRSILKHLQDDNANFCESPGHDGSDSDCDSSAHDDNEGGHETSGDNEVDNGRRHDPKEYLRKQALYELHGYEVEQQTDALAIQHKLCHSTRACTPGRPPILAKREAEKVLKPSSSAQHYKSFCFTNAKKEISKNDVFEFANNTAQRLRDLELTEIPDDILVLDPLAVVAWAYHLRLGLTNLAGLGLNLARHFVEKRQDAAQGRLGREFYVSLRSLRRTSKPGVQNVLGDSSAQRPEAASATSTTRSISESPSSTLFEATARKRLPETDHGEEISHRKRPRHMSVSSLLNIEDVDRSSGLPRTTFAAQQSLARQAIQAHGSGPSGCPTGASGQSDLLDGFSMDNMLNWETMGNSTDGVLAGSTFDDSLIGAGMDYDILSWDPVGCLTEEQIAALLPAEAMSTSSGV